VSSLLRVGALSKKSSSRRRSLVQPGSKSRSASFVAMLARLGRICCWLSTLGSSGELGPRVSGSGNDPRVAGWQTVRRARRGIGRFRRSGALEPSACSTVTDHGLTKIAEPEASCAITKVCYTYLRAVHVGPKEGRVEPEETRGFIRGGRFCVRRSARRDAGRCSGPSARDSRRSVRERDGFCSLSSSSNPRTRSASSARDALRPMRGNAMKKATGKKPGGPSRASLHESPK